MTAGEIVVLAIGAVGAVATLKAMGNLIAEEVRGRRNTER